MRAALQTMMRTLTRAPQTAMFPVFVFAVLAVLLVRLLPAPHSRLQYLVVGTLATGGALVGVFLRLVVLANRRRASEQSR